MNELHMTRLQIRWIREAEARLKSARAYQLQADRMVRTAMAELHKALKAAQQPTEIREDIPA